MNEIEEVVKKWIQRSQNDFKIGQEVRYTEDFYMPTLDETKKCLKITKKARSFVRTKLKNRGMKNL